MAIDHLFAFSSSVDGAGIAAGNPYGCGLLLKPWTRCYYGNINVSNAVEYALRREKEGDIDPLKNLWETPVHLFSGTGDWVVYEEVMQEAKRQLEHFVAPSLLSANFNTTATHVWSIDDWAGARRGRECKCGACPWTDVWDKECCDVNNCGYDLSGDMLQRFMGGGWGAAKELAVEAHEYSKKKKKETTNGSSTVFRRHRGLHPRVSTLSSPPLYFRVDQWQSLNTSNLPPWALRHRGRWTHMLRYGYAYVPRQCRKTPSSCLLYVHYHGCMGRRDRLRWIGSVQLNEYAESNGIVVYYPQASGDQRTGVGCWNWSAAKDDPLFDTRYSIQLQVVVNILKDIDHALLLPNLNQSSLAAS